MKQLKHIAICILTGIMLIFGFGITLHHLICDCCVVHNTAGSLQSKGQPSDCCHAVPDSGNPDEAAKSTCNCAVSLCQSGLHEETLISSSSHSWSTINILPFFFSLLLLLRKPVFLSNKHVSSSHCRIASGRERLTLHAILII